MAEIGSHGLGPCCICESTENVRTIVMLALRNQVPGRGWGCFVCDLPPDGASAVICDACVPAYRGGTLQLRWACRGWPASDGRAPIEELTEPFDHDRTVDHG